MYSSRHKHALRRSREGSGRFVGGPVDNIATTNETSPNTSSPLSYQSEPNVTTSTATNNYLPFSDHQIETVQEPHQAGSASNTNNNNHHLGGEEENCFQSSSEGEGTPSGVNGEQSRGTVITSVTVS